MEQERSDEADYGNENYLELDTAIPGRCQFAFVDTSEYLADQVFINKEIPVRFSGREYHHPDSEYIVIFCTVRKKYREAFIASMGDLERKMLLCGHMDYSDSCRERFVPLIESAERSSKKPS